MLSQPIVSNCSVESFNIGVLLGFARLNVFQFNATFSCPCNHSRTDEHLVRYATQRDLSPRMLKRYAVLATFLDEHYSSLTSHFRDQTPYSSIEELVKLHRISEQAASDIAKQVISGEMIASDVKACAEQVVRKFSVKAHESTRSEARRATLLLREAVHLEIERKYSLNKRHRAMPHLSKLFTLDSALIQALRQAVSKMPAAAALVFGSYADGTHSEDSDIDILVVSDDLSKVSAGALFKPLARQVEKEINITLVGSKEFAERKLNTEGFWFNVFKNPIVLKGEFQT